MGSYLRVEDDERNLKYLPQIALELASFNFNCPGRGVIEHEHSIPPPT
jgi:hypothetical protein